MMLRGVRGAITVDENTKEEILSRTQELLRAIVTVNDIHTDDIASAIFTVTDDLNAEFPAVAARTIGWISQWNEMMGDEENRIGRPRQIYLGETRRDYVPVSQR